ncbi:MAG: 16S rRNA processing protein RimM [Clostridia bacterium]|nr:16S rRNA processing protein RimM [Clostridia bacterium]
MREFIEAGRIVNIHGIKGAVKAESWCDNPAVLKNMNRIFLKSCENGSVYVEKKVITASVIGEFVIMRLEGVSSPEQASALKNVVFFVHRDDIPVDDGSVLIDDIKDLPVIDSDTGRTYGFLHDVVKIGGRDLYEINCEGKPVLLPAVREFIKKIDVGRGIFISPIEGFFDED